MWTNDVQLATGDLTTVQAAIDALSSTSTGTRIRLPATGTATWNSSLRIQNKSNVYLDIRGFVVVAGPGLDGSDQNTKNNLINCINGVGAPFDPYMSNVWVFSHEGGVLDCRLQNKTGIVGNGEGINLCAIEMQNINGSRIFGLVIDTAYGNGVAHASIDPRYAWKVLPTYIEQNRFVNCCPDQLGSIYGITGTCIQAGAMVNGFIRSNQFASPGGAAISLFNCNGTLVESNYVTGIGAANKWGTPQLGRVGAIESDFGLTGCTIRGNTLSSAGGIFFLGHGLADFFTGYVPTTGPMGNLIEGNNLIGTGTLPAPTPAVPSNLNDVVQNPSALPLLIITGAGAGAGFQISANGVGGWQTVTPSTDVSRCYVVPGSYYMRWATQLPLAWTWEYAPNATAGHIVMTAGNTTLTGTTQAGGGAQTIKLPASFSPNDGTYVGMTITLTPPAGTLQTRTITAYNGTTKIATHAGAAYSAAPDGVSFTMATGVVQLIQNNVVRDNVLTRSPSAAFDIYDARNNTFGHQGHGNLITNPGYYVQNHAFIGNDSNVLSGCGYRQNYHGYNQIYDTRSTKQMFSNLNLASANSTDNTWEYNRVETGSAGTYTGHATAIATTRLHRKGNYGSPAISDEPTKGSIGRLAGGSVTVGGYWARQGARN